MKKTKEDKCDALIVGAGVVGSYLARRIAEEGHKVIIVDKRSRAELGGWKNSGHNIDKDVFKKLPVEPPAESEIGAQVEYAEFRGPNTHFKFRLPMYNVRLGLFTRRILDDAMDAGASFQGGVECLGAEIEDGCVVGIKARKEGGDVSYRAKLVVDVSGICAVVRNSLPDEFGIDKKMTPFDYLNVYSEDRKVDPAHWPVPFTYHSVMQGWSGSRRPGVIGLGLGRFGYTGEDPAEACRALARQALSVPGEVIFKTRARVPVRHPLHKLAAPGVMILGDAAYQGKPLNGEGLSVMLYAAETAAGVAARALANDDVSEESLWDYSYRYQRKWGKRFAPIHRLRYELSRFSKEEQAFTMGLGLYGPEEMSSIMLDGKLEISALQLANKVRNGWKAIFKPDLVIRLARASLQGSKLTELYRQYPRKPADITDWAAEADHLFRHD